MSVYVISDPARPWVALFSATGLGEVAQAATAQQRQLAIYISKGGAGVPLPATDIDTLREAIAPTHEILLASLPHVVVQPTSAT